MRGLGSIKPETNQIHRTGTEKSSEICAQQLHGPNTRSVINIVKSLKSENLEDRTKSARLCMLFKIQHELIDIDSHQYLTPNDSRTRGKNRSNQEGPKTDTYRQSLFPKTIRDRN